ncbi:MAG: DUF3365 domain-containing protein [Pseudomonadales bacterium]|nr:DUF3365 domain-containing protein [Pseudomonadales bacterium]
MAVNPRHLYSLPVIAIVFFLILVTVGYIGVHMRNALIKNSALSYADIYSTAIEEFRSLYTSEVVSILSKSNDISVRHDYKEHRNAVPLPATLSMLLGEKIGQRTEGAQVKLYSQYPFPWNKSKGGLQDNFSKNAWQQLTDNPYIPYYRFVETPAGLSLKYAKADLMRERCVDCHNNHPDTPKNDWKVGDVRGILQVTLPLHTLLEASLKELYISFFVYCIVLLSGLFFIFKIVSDLKVTTAELERKAINLSTEATIRKAAEEEALSNQKRAEEASSAKSAFLSTMSHELRTPMNAIIGFTGLLIRRFENGDKQLKLLTRIEIASNTLLSLINDILDLSKVEAGKINFERIEFDFYKTIDTAISLFYDQASEKKIELTLKISPEIPSTLYGDPVRLCQIMTNIVGNAIKFTPSGTVQIKIDLVQLTHDKATLGFSIQDSGIGMNEAQQSVIFDPFVQADDSTSRKFGGSGLGLAICKRLVNLMEGRISVTSELNAGSCFHFNINLFRQLETALNDATESQNKGKSDNSQLEQISQPQKELTMPTPQRLAEQSNNTDFQSTIRILLAEEHIENRHAITSILDEMEYDYSVAVDGDELLDMLDKEQYDMVMVGIVLSNKDAFEITGTLRAKHQNKNIPIIGLCSTKLHVDADNCLVAGMNEYIVAPYTFDQIEKLLIRWTRQFLTSKERTMSDAANQIKH